MDSASAEFGLVGQIIAPAFDREQASAEQRCGRLNLVPSRGLLGTSGDARLLAEASVLVLRSSTTWRLQLMVMGTHGSDMEVIM